jgi:tetratricopeptide (TPR) repeat protein
METHQVSASVDVSGSTQLTKALRPKAPLKDRWQVLVLVPLVVAIVPLVNTLLRKERPERHDLVQINNFSERMFVANVSLILQQYQTKTGQALNDPDLKNKIENAGRLSAGDNFAAAASILSEVAQSVPVAAVYNNLGVALANGNDLDRAEQAFHDALRADPDYKAAWVNLGLVQQKEDKLDDALGSFLKAPDFAARQIKAIGEELKPKPAAPSPDQTAATQAIAANGNGHDILHPRPIAVGVERQDTSAGKPNYFRFVAPPKYRDLVVVSITNRSTTFAPSLTLFNADKSNFGANQFNYTAGANLEYTFAAQPSCTYYVSVDAITGTGGDYTLLVKPLKAYDRYEPNDDIMHSSAIDLGRPIEANIMDRDDLDYYRFRSPASARNIEVSVANRPTTLSPLLNVFDEDRSNISGNQYNPTNGGCVRYTFTAQPNQTYYVAVKSWDGFGDYTLTLQPR